MSKKTLVNYQGKKISRASGLERRLLIIKATWRIIIKNGMRGVRHRAVASEAGVPLAATTYYFRNLEELITSAFTHWAEQAAVYNVRFREDCDAVISDIDESSMQDKRVRTKLAEQVSELTCAHIVNQIVKRSDDRILELAFQHEALRNDKLKTLVVSQQYAFIKGLKAFHKKIGSKAPEADARISISIISRLEQEASMLGLDEFDQSCISSAVRRHVFSVFEMADPRVNQ